MQDTWLLNHICVMLKIGFFLGLLTQNYEIMILDDNLSIPIYWIVNPFEYFTFGKITNTIPGL